MTYDLDLEILKLFQNNKNIIVPKILQEFKKEKIVILENFNSKGFKFAPKILVQASQIYKKTYLHLI